jgi:hypothetical protein
MELPGAVGNHWKIRRTKRNMRDMKIVHGFTQAIDFARGQTEYDRFSIG